MLFDLAMIADQRNELNIAERYNRETLKVAIEIGAKFEVATSLLALGRFLITRRGYYDEGCRLLQEAARLFDQMGIPGGDEARKAIRDLGCEP